MRNNLEYVSSSTASCKDWIVRRRIHIHYILAADAAIQLRGSFQAVSLALFSDCIAAGFVPTVAIVDRC